MHTATRQLYGRLTISVIRRKQTPPKRQEGEKAENYEFVGCAVSSRQFRLKRRRVETENNLQSQKMLSIDFDTTSPANERTNAHANV